MNLVAARGHLSACTTGCTGGGSDGGSFSSSGNRPHDTSNDGPSAEESAGTSIFTDARPPVRVVGFAGGIDHVTPSGNPDGFQVERHFMRSDLPNDEFSRRASANDQIPIGCEYVPVHRGRVDSTAIPLYPIDIFTRAHGDLRARNDLVGAC